MSFQFQKAVHQWRPHTTKVEYMATAAHHPNTQHYNTKKLTLVFALFVQWSTSYPYMKIYMASTRIVLMRRRKNVTVRLNISLLLDRDVLYLWFRLHPYVKQYSTSSVTTSTRIVVTKDKIGIMKNCKCEG